MKKMGLRAISEIIGTVSIVAGLLLVAWEVHQANNIAKAEVVLQLAAQYNEFNSARFQSPAVADLSLAMLGRNEQELSDTDRSMMAGAAWHFGNIAWSAQVAHDSGLLSRAELDKYRDDLAWMIEYMPGLREEFAFMYKSMPNVRNEYVFQPIRQYLLESDPGSIDGNEDK